MQKYTLSIDNGTRKKFRGNNIGKVWEKASDFICCSYSTLKKLESRRYQNTILFQAFDANDGILLTASLDERN